MRGFTIQFEDRKGGFNMNLLWDTTKVSIPIKVIGEIEQISVLKKRKRNK